MPYFFQKLDKMSQNLSSAAVVIGAFRVNIQPQIQIAVCAKKYNIEEKTRKYILKKQSELPLPIPWNSVKLT